MFSNRAFNKIHVRGITVSVVVWTFLAFLSSSAFSADQEFKMEKPEKGRFIVEHVYNYWKQAFTPPVTMRFITKPSENRRTPELCTVNHLSSMKAGDYDWWLSGWDETSREGLIAANKEQGRDEQFWKDRWAKAMDGRHFIFLERVESGPYAFVWYKMLDKKGKAVFEQTHVCKQKGFDWYTTQELSKDLMFHHYVKGDRKVTIEVR